MVERARLLKLAPALVLDYVRWTQLSPLIAIWAVAVGMLAALLFVDYEAQSWNALGSLVEWIAGLPVIGDRFTAWLESLAGDDGTIELSGDEIRSRVLEAWALLSFACMVLGIVVSWIFGPFKPWPLERKLGIAALCCLALLAGFIAVYFTNPEQFNGPARNWMLMFGGLASVLFVASAWCLAIAHVLDLARRLWMSRARGTATATVPGASRGRSAETVN